VDLLSVAQVSAIYSGTITNWKELGGNDAPILVYAMPPDTEAYNFFRDKVLRPRGWGRGLIRLYYRGAPRVCDGLERWPVMRRTDIMIYQDTPSKIGNW
jgi:hypothetical protein